MTLPPRWLQGLAGVRVQPVGVALPSGRGRDRCFPARLGAGQRGPEETPMQFTTRAVRRGLAAFAMTSAAVLVPTVALAAPGGRATATRPAADAQAATAAAPRCAAGELTVWLGIPGDGGARKRVLARLKGACPTHQGRPARCTASPGCPPGSAQTARAASWAGRRPATTRTLPGSLVTLRRGATAHVLLKVVDVGNFDRRPATRPPRWRCASTRRTTASRWRGPLVPGLPEERAGVPLRTDHGRRGRDPGLHHWHLRKP